MYGVFNSAYGNRNAVFFNLFKKRQTLLNHIEDVNCKNSNSKKILIRICKIKWSEI